MTMARERGRTGGSRPIRILFNVRADEDNVNAQSLNARDLALRLDQQRFRSALFAHRPDPRLRGHEHIRVVRLPPRLATCVLAPTLLWGRHDIVVHPPFDHLGRIWRRVGRIGRHPRSVVPVEGTAAQLVETLGFSRARAMLEQADARAAISPFIAASVEETFGLCCESVNIGVDLSLFAPADASTANRDGPPVVISVASIQPRKRLGLLLDLALELGPDQATFVIVGNPIGGGQHLEELQRLRAQRELHHVQFRPGVPQHEVARLLRASDVFVLPSRLEGVPKVTLEAAAAGLPAVVFEDYHSPSVIDGRTGFAVRTDGEMLTRLRQLTTDVELRARMGHDAVAHAQQFAWERVVPGWAALFERVVAETAGDRRAMA